MTRARSIPFFDYRPWLRPMEREIQAAVTEVIRSGRLVLGPQGEAFEREFAAHTGARAAVGVASGTDALILALRALEIGPGDEVITVANAGVPPVAAIRATGATPRFVDVSPESLLIDAAGLEAARTPRTRCVLPVHLYGRPVPMAPILEFARRHGLRVVEDCAQAHGASLEGTHVGRFGDIGCFSFYPTKNLGALGDGGLCLTGDDDLERRLRLLRFYGFSPRREAVVEGLNSRLDEMQAAILRVELRRLDAAVARRRALARRYTEALAGTELRPVGGPDDGAEHAYHLYVVRTGARARAIAELEAAGIGYGLHYPEPVHTMQAYGFLGLAPGDLPVTERACDEVLSLPLYPGMPEEHVDLTVRALEAPDGDGPSRPR